MDILWQSSTCSSSTPTYHEMDICEYKQSLNTEGIDGCLWGTLLLLFGIVPLDKLSMDQWPLHQQELGKIGECSNYNLH